MSDAKDKQTSPATYMWAAALAALVGFAAVYVSRAPDDNAKSPDSAAVAPQPKPAEARPAAGGAAPSTMAAFVKRANPEAIADVAFQDGEGRAITLSAFKGRTVLLNLWATWCAPCRKEMPALDRLQKELGSDKFEVVALAVDRAETAAIRKFLLETGVASLKFYVDPTAKAGTALKAGGMPTTILIGKDGLELGRLVGPAEWDSPDAKKLIEAAL
jgi:thiol-disulfide isomerase/thioredoxin